MRENDIDASKSVSQYIRDLEKDMKNAEKYAREHALFPRSSTQITTMLVQKTKRSA